MADPPWRFQNRTGKVAPEHRRLSRYETLSLDDICALPVREHLHEVAHCYLWVPNALLPHGLLVLGAWGFQYKTNLIWHKVRKDGGSDGRGVGFYFRNVTEMLLFGVRGKNARTLDAGRRQVNLFASRKREHSRKPDEQYDIIESCSRGPYLELFGRGVVATGWCGATRRTTAMSPAGIPTGSTLLLPRDHRRAQTGLVQHLDPQPRARRPRPGLPRSAGGAVRGAVRYQHPRPRPHQGRRREVTDHASDRGVSVRHRLAEAQLRGEETSR